MIASLHTVARRALVLIPGSVNYFYNQTGRRVAEALGEIGWHVDVRTLAECLPDDAPYDLCVASNLSEIQFGYGNEAEFVERLAAIRKPSTITLSLVLDCVATPWFRRLCELGHQCGVDATLDLGLMNQKKRIPSDVAVDYLFAFNGLTASERTQLEAGFSDDRRTLPWVTVGHNTPHRVALVDYLIEHIHPGGFVYLPALSPCTETNSPHLNQQQFERVLQHARYQVWRSHHQYFYLEPERFRMSALTGSIPVKVVEPDEPIPPEMPFGYLVMTPEDLATRLSDPNAFHKVRDIHQRDWLQRPSLANSLASVLDWFELHASSPRRHAA